jgi:hypothetical protein
MGVNPYRYEVGRRQVRQDGWVMHQSVAQRPAVKRMKTEPYSVLRHFRYVPNGLSLN